MKIKKSELLEALEIVKPGLANNDNIEQTTSFAFLKGKVITYNDEISLSHQVEGLELNGAIHAGEFHALLNKLKEEEIEMKEKGKEILIKCGRAKAGFTLQSEVTLPLEEIGNVGEWKSLPKPFLRLIRMALGCVSTDSTKPKLNCVHVTKDGGVEASDNHRLIRGELGEKMPLSNFLLPARAVKEVINMKAVKISKGNGWVHFKNKAGTVLSCRVYDETFVNIRKVLEAENEGITLLLPAGLKEVLNRAASLNTGGALEEAVEITLGKNRLIIKKKSETAWFEEKIDIDFKEEPFSFRVTPYLLMDILNDVDECHIDENKIEFKGKDWTFISALRMSE